MEYSYLCNVRDHAIEILLNVTLRQVEMRSGGLGEHELDKISRWVTIHGYTK